MNTAESYLARWFAWTRPRVHEICQQIVVMEQAACRCCRYIYIVRMSGLGGLEEVDRPSQMEVGRTTKVPSITEILNIVASKQFPPVPEAQTATKKKKEYDISVLSARNRTVGSPSGPPTHPTT